MSTKTFKINNDVLTDEVRELLASVGVEVPTTKITKGQLIFDEIEKSVVSGEFVTRNEIANNVAQIHESGKCTVSRVSEILGEFADTDVVKGYHILDAQTKIIRQNEKELIKLQKAQDKINERLQKLHTNA